MGKDINDQAKEPRPFIVLADKLDEDVDFPQYVGPALTASPLRGPDGAVHSWELESSDEWHRLGYDDGDGILCESIEPAKDNSGLAMATVVDEFYDSELKLTGRFAVSFLVCTEFVEWKEA